MCVCVWVVVLACASSRGNFGRLFVLLSPCSSLPCKENGKCVTHYETKGYVCVCKKEFTGKHCKLGKDLERTTKVVIVSVAVVTVPFP